MHKILQRYKSSHNYLKYTHILGNEVTFKGYHNSAEELKLNFRFFWHVRLA